MVDENALGKIQDQYAVQNGKYKDMSIRAIIEDYESARTALTQCEVSAVDHLVAEMKKSDEREYPKNNLRPSSDYYQSRAKEIIAMLGPYIRQPVSLEKCAMELFGSKEHWHSKYTTEENREWYREKAKAVLEAAGVPYVD